MKVVIDGVEYIPKNEIPIDFAKMVLLENLLKELIEEIYFSFDQAKQYHESLGDDLNVSKIEAEGVYRGLKHLTENVQCISGIDKYLPKEEQ